MRYSRHVAAVALTAALSAGSGRSIAAVGNPAEVAIVSGAPEDAAGTAARAYAGAFRAVGYSVRWLRIDELERAEGALLVVPRAEALRLTEMERRRLVALVAAGGRLIIAGGSPLARDVGVRVAGIALKLQGIVDAADPAVTIGWKHATRFHPFSAPEPTQVLARVRGSSRPVVVAFRHGRGTVLFLGVELDEESALGSSRFPFFLQAVGETFQTAPALMATGLTVYADLGDHPLAEPLRLAREWHERGIGEVHLGAWDSLGAKAGVFAELLAACHRFGIRVYAWLEPPEISTAFWDAHPEWREKTATGRDAQVDWRRLMALTDPACYGAAEEELRKTVESFGWDGVDLAEIYFESPAGPESPESFTPMNRFVRDEASRVCGLDPQELFDARSPHYWKRDPRAFEVFLGFRRDLVVDLHHRLMETIAGLRGERRPLDLVLTLVDGLYDQDMRDYIAVDPARIVALADTFGFALQVEDPFTLWTLGPERYARIAADYSGLTRSGERLSIDINVVERETGGFPTRKQTGLELYQLAAEARRRFGAVCFYSEATIAPVDRVLLRSALASTARLDWKSPGDLDVDSDGRIELETGGTWSAAAIDGRPWPAGSEASLLLPKGRHHVAWTIGPAPAGGAPLERVNATLLDSGWDGKTLAVRYTAPGPAYLELSFRPARVAVDGKAAMVPVIDGEHGAIVMAPPGEHLVSFVRE